LFLLRSVGKELAMASPRDVRERLRDVGLRATRPRVLVYEVLREAGGHRSVDEIVGLIRERGQSVTRMSVYNVVSDLQAAGIVMCADTGPGRALYEVGETWHHHFVCRVCGSIVDIPCVTGKKRCLDSPPAFGGTVEEAQVVFRGVCETCAIET
jgi:Fur family ferric uptake transcriptional regulator